MTESSSKMSKSRSKLRRASIVTSASQSLRETLSAFGDDVIKVPRHRPTDNPSLREGGNGLGNGVNPSELTFPPGQGHDLHFDLMASLSSQQQQLKFDTFERIPSSEVGVRSSRWKKAIIAKLFSSKLSTRKDEEGEGARGNEGCEEGRWGPPFWGVGRDRRAKVSTLTLQLILHEIACFTSSVLLGCLVVQALEGISWIKNPVLKDNFLFSRLYGSFSTFLLVFTSLGFLLRVDSGNTSSLLRLPLHLIPIVILSVLEYLNKSWELQREECDNYFKMEQGTNVGADLSQNCDSYHPHKSRGHFATDPDASLIITRICPPIIAFGISFYLFVSRASFYMIN